MFTVKNCIIVLVISLLAATSLLQTAYTAETNSNADQDSFQKGNIVNQSGSGKKINSAVKNKPNVQPNKNIKQSKEIIVKYKNANKAESIKSKVKRKFSDSSFKVRKKIKKNTIDVIDVSEKVDASSILSTFKNDPDVEYAQENIKYFSADISDNPDLPRQWGINNGNVPGADVDALPVYNLTEGDNNVVVGVLDTGVDINHEDLKDNIFTNPGEAIDKANNSIDDDGNGFIDDVHGWDFADDNNTVYDSSDSDFHGTHVAGIIAASDNSKGIIGIAPKVKIIPLKFIKMHDDGNEYGYTSDAIDAIEYAKKMGIKIINCSWGSTASDDLLKSEMADSGILFVCAAGNSIFNEPSYPASFNLPNIISVAAIDQTGQLAYFSDYGLNIDVAAPGVNILSTMPNNSYDYLSGTSMASPFVAGIAALLKSFDSSLTIAQIKQRITGSVNTSDYLAGKLGTGGMADAYAALVQPANIGAKAVADENSISLTWNKDQNAIRYEVKEDSIVIDNGNSTSFIHGGLPNNSTHFYKIRAIYDSGPGQWSSGFLKKTLTSGTGNGFRGEYFNNSNLTDINLIRTDSSIDFSWTEGGLKSLNPNSNFSARWSGVIVPRYDETYTFYANVDGGVRLWIDDKLIIDKWSNSGNNEFSGSIAMNSEWPKSIKMEYCGKSAEPHAKLYWSSQSQQKEIVPTSKVFSTPYLGSGGEWSVKESMPTKRYSSVAATVDNKIYVMGGMTGSSPGTSWEYNLDTVEAYDTINNTWSPKADLLAANHYFGAAAINGKIYIVGGERAYDASSKRVDEYNPTTNSWTQKADMLTGRYLLSAVECNGKMYAIGGYSDTVSAFINAVEEYNPITNQWIAKAPMPTATLQCAVASYNGKIYVFGGTSDGINMTDKVEVFDPINNTWEEKAHMNEARVNASAASINGKIYVIGGYDNNGKSSDVEEYDPVLDIWVTRENMPTPREYLTASAVNGKIYAIGGILDSSLWHKDIALTTVEEFTPVPSAKITSFTSDYSSPQTAGTVIRLSSSASGGLSAVLYKFSVFENNVWTIKQDFSEQNYYDWIPSTPGSYQLCVYVKDKNSVNDYDDKLDLSFTVNADKTALAAKLAEVNALNQLNYTSASWSSLQTALNAAVSINNKSDATQLEVDSALVNLQTAMSGLVYDIPEPPIADVASGTYTGVQTVSLTTTSSGAVIYYTTDGTAPCTSSAVYVNPINITSTCTLKAVSYKYGLYSDVSSFSYIVNIPLTVPISSVSIKSSTTLTEGQTEQLTAAVLPDNATNKNVLWSVSTGSDTVTVSPTGLVTAVKAGTAKVRVTSASDSTKYAECTVTVNKNIKQIYLRVSEDGRLKSPDDAVYYTFTASTDGAYAFFVETALMDRGKITAIAFDKDGSPLTPIKTDNYVNIFSLKASKAYTIKISANGNTLGDIPHLYSLFVKEVRPINAGETVSGKLDTDGSSNTCSYEFYIFKPTETGTYPITNLFDKNKPIFVWDSDGNRLDWIASNANKLSCTAGKAYYAGVDLYHIVNGNYSFKIDSLPKQDNTKSSTPSSTNITVINNAGINDTLKVKGITIGDVIKVYDAPTNGNTLCSLKLAAYIAEAVTSMKLPSAASGYVYISITNKGKTESDRVKIAYDAEPMSSSPSAASITITNNAGSGDTVKITSLAAADVVKVYDSAAKGKQLGSAVVAAKNTEAVVSVKLPSASTGSVYVSVTSKAKDESDLVKADYNAELVSSSPSAEKITVTNNAGSGDTVKITGLAAADVVKVYDSAAKGKQLGSATVAAKNTEAVVSVKLPSASNGSIYVSVTSKAKNESDRVKVNYDAELVSSSPSAEKITVTNNAGSGDTVKISGLAIADVVKVYDSEVKGKQLGSATVAAKNTEVVVSVKLPSASNGSIYVSVTSKAKNESDRVKVNYGPEPVSSPLNAAAIKVAAKANTKYTITVSGLISGDVIKIYDSITQGKLIQTGKASSDNADVSVTITNSSKKSIYISLTNKNKLESDRIKIDFSNL